MWYSKPHERGQKKKKKFERLFQQFVSIKEGTFNYQSLLLLFIESKNFILVCHMESKFPFSFLVYLKLTPCHIFNIIDSASEASKSRQNQTGHDKKIRAENIDKGKKSNQEKLLIRRKIDMPVPQFSSV